MGVCNTHEEIDAASAEQAEIDAAAAEQTVKHIPMAEIAFGPLSAATIVVADEGNNRLQLLTPEGAHISTIASKGSGPGQFNSPKTVTFNADGNILLVDTHNHRLCC